MCVTENLLDEILGYSGRSFTQDREHMLKHVFFLVCLNRAGDSERADTVFDIIIDWNCQAPIPTANSSVVKSVALLMTLLDFFHKDGFYL